ncbi:hypothetical protein [Hugenholtzia roseola]|uniref:hypothetical protein n=1 Tax=Hugenholtzia roseola TaxID=1002 RepID=UPI0004069386|nr:hypothetical protein [Hugenholtzia roseola]
MKKYTFLLWLLPLAFAFFWATEEWNSHDLEPEELQLLEQQTQALQSLLREHDRERTLLGNLRYTTAQSSLDTQTLYYQAEATFESMQSIRERLAAFRVQFVENRPSKEPIALTEANLSLLLDSLVSYQQYIANEVCKDCEEITQMAYGYEKNLWDLQKAYPAIWKIALFTTDCQLLTTYSRVLEKKIPDSIRAQHLNRFPFERGRVYVRPDFRILEEGKTYQADLFYGLEVGQIRNFPSINTNFQKVFVNSQGVGRIAFNTWASNYDLRSGLHKVWEARVFVDRDYFLHQNQLPFQDTTIVVEADYILKREFD